ncbi:DUF4358 domain-containing protein [Sedimentibacter sp. zth1]|uniref:DUF4358 domain-containing protein n=1 Tax=Sedimentibacter sp. zth1 TaxID=2816908 RepID=UPI001A939D03|nr:DUF4358 domain-containing protein [Sedimentibacter sp. zth1]QSX05227.1 DUF4358 domain-containing protein [Sedimentibacter sp. zth1]
MKTKGIKIITLLLLSIFMVGCTAKEDVSINVEALMNDAKEAAQFEDDLVELDKDIVNNIYTSLDLADVKEFKILTSSTSVKAEEIAIFEANDANAAQRILDSVEERLSDMKLGFEGYIPEELAIAENAIVKKEGNYVLFAVGKNYKEIDSIFNKYIDK